MAIPSCFGLFQDEINQFLWWPLHLSGWLLALGPIPLLIAVHLLHQDTVVVGLGPAWVVLGIAGVCVVGVTFRAHQRLDTYRGF